MDPFRILNLRGRAGKREIIRAAALALRERRHSAREVALAQKALMDPVSRACHEFLDLMDIDPERLRPPEEGAPSLEYLPVFERRGEDGRSGP